jgi:hypothetical protein
MQFAAQHQFVVFVVQLDRTKYRATFPMQEKSETLQATGETACDAVANVLTDLAAMIRTDAANMTVLVTDALPDSGSVEARKKTERVLRGLS